MKVLHIASGDLWAGAEVQLYHLARALAADPAIELQVVLMNEGQLAQALRASGIRVVVFDEIRLSGPRILIELFRLVRSVMPDLIHTHRSKENVIGGLVAFVTGRPSVRTVHGASEFADAPFSLKRAVFGFLDRFAGRVFQKKVIAVSDELAAKLTRFFPPSKLSTIANGINIEDVLDKSNAMADFAPPAVHFNIAFVGRFVPVKRPDIFVDIAVDVLARPGNSNIHFHMFGDGPLRVDVTRRIRESGYQERIHTYGFVSNVAPYLKQMDLLLFTSDHEGLPMTLLEAMALQVAVMTRNLPTIRQVLCNGECGYVLASDAVAEFSAAIEQVCRNREAREAKQAMALAHLQANFSIARIARQYVALYQAIVKPHAGIL